MIFSALALQDAISPVIYSLTEFHDTAIMFIAFIVTYVFFIILFILVNSSRAQSLHEAHELETVWTLLPAIVLIFLALPSLRLLYLLDEASSPTLTVKTIGHQWYWRYEYADFISLEFESYITPTSDLPTGASRLLEVDNRLVIPWGIETRVLVTAADVIHSWTIPRLGLKVDAIPGRLNQLSILAVQPGLFYGQCSEICGANHSFIPISIEVVSFIDWLKWRVKTIKIL